MAEALRYGVVGNGHMGQEHIRNLQLVGDAEVVALADTNAESRAAAAALVGETPRVYESHHTLLEDPAALARGKAIFTGTCSGYCHLTVPGPRDEPYLFDCEWLHGSSDEAIFATIAQGVPGTQMVAFGGALPEGDDVIWRVVAWLKSARAPC